MADKDGLAPQFGLTRREYILDELRRAGSVRVAELAPALGVSELTIRRDISTLADRGLLSRVHGGATLRSALDTTAPLSGKSAGPLLRIGMVTPSLTYYWPQVIIGARSAAIDHGVHLVLRGSSYSVEDQRAQIMSLVSSGDLHGLIVAPEIDGDDGKALVRWLDSLPIPVMLVERRVPSSLAVTHLDWVTTDHVFGGSLAAQHLASLGHQRVGLLTSTGSPTTPRLRAGWMRAVEQLGLTAPVDIDSDLDGIDASARHAVIDDLLAQCRASGVTALLAHSDPQAILVQQHMRQRGWSVPADLALIAYDDEVAASADPPITALRPPRQQVGRCAVEHIVARLNDSSPRATQRTYLLPTLHVRGSTSLSAPMARS